MDNYTNDLAYENDDSYADELYEDLSNSLLDDDDSYESDESEGEEEWQPFSEEEVEGFRSTLAQPYASLSTEQLCESLSGLYNSVSPAEEFNLKSAFEKIGSAGQALVKSPLVSQIGAAALPIAGTAAGTFFGGPVGAALGSKLGQSASSALFHGKPSAAAPSNAAGKLLQLTQSAPVLRALGSAAAGKIGSPTIASGSNGQAFDIGSILNMFAALAQQASADAEEMLDVSAATVNTAEEYISPEARMFSTYESLMAAENEEFGDY